jgi:predicted enzyme related to lactoylglutathione lyase
MKAEINLITIWTDDVEKMKDFYSRVIGFETINDLGDYVEFRSSGVRFAICKRSVMVGFSQEYLKKPSGQGFELAFPCQTPEDVDLSYESIVKLGAVPVHEPQDMPWNQRTALFADPEGNIHELFAELE